METEMIFLNFFLSLIAGLVSAYVINYLDKQKYIEQSKQQIKYQEDIKRRDMLRDIYSLISLIYAKFISNGWGEGEKYTGEEKELIEYYQSKIEATKVMYLGNDEMYKVLQGLRNLVGAKNYLYQKSGLFNTGEVVTGYENRIKEEILRLDESLSPQIINKPRTK